MHLMYVAYFEREEGVKKRKRKNKHKIKYFLSSSECLGLLQNLFSASAISFVSSHWEQAKGI